MAQNSGHIFNLWGLNFMIGLIQDVAFTQIVKIYIIYVVGVSSMKPQLQAIHDVFVDLITRYPYDIARNEDAKDLHLVQHISPTCRAARNPGARNLVSGRILQMVNDVDVARCQVHRKRTMGYVAILLLAIPTVVSLFSATIGSVLIDVILPSFSAAFVLVNSLIYSLSSNFLGLAYIILIFLFLTTYFSIWWIRKNNRMGFYQTLKALYRRLTCKRVVSRSDQSWENMNRPSKFHGRVMSKSQSRRRSADDDVFNIPAAVSIMQSAHRMIHNTAEIRDERRLLSKSLRDLDVGILGGADERLEIHIEKFKTGRLAQRKSLLIVDVNDALRLIDQFLFPEGSYNNSVESIKKKMKYCGIREIVVVLDYVWDRFAPAGKRLSGEEREEVIVSFISWIEKISEDRLISSEVVSNRSSRRLGGLATSCFFIDFEVWFREVVRGFERRNVH